MQEVFRAIGRLSQSSATVLITGESGTGKELVARALHRHSTRVAKPFVAINTADNWLHLVLGGGLLGGWFVSKGAAEGATDRRATTPAA